MNSHSLNYKIGQTKYTVDIPTVSVTLISTFSSVNLLDMYHSMGITTTEMDDDVVYCDIKTTAKVGIPYFSTYIVNFLVRCGTYLLSTGPALGSNIMLQISPRMLLA